MERLRRLKLFLIIFLLATGEREATEEQRRKLEIKKINVYSAAIPDDRIYPNLGVAYKEIAKLQTTREVYTIHLVVELPHVNDIIQSIRKATDDLWPPCRIPEKDKGKYSGDPWYFCNNHKYRFEGIQQYRNKILKEFEHKMDQLKENMPILRGEPLTKINGGKQKRAILSLIALPLFGGLIASAWAHKRIHELEKKVELIAEATGTLYENQAKLGEALSKLANFTVTEFQQVYGHINRISTDLAEFKEAIRHEHAELVKLTLANIRIMNYLSRMQLSIQEYHLSVGDTLDRMIKIFHDLNLGRLPFELVTYSQLQNILTDVEEEIDATFPGYGLVYTDASDYFSTDNIVATVVNHTLVVQIPAYIKQKNQALFTLYRVHSVYVPYNIKTANELPDAVKRYSYTRANVGATHFAASSEDYMTLEMGLLAECEKRGGIYICPQIFVHTHRQRVTCLSAIYWQHSFKEIQEKCDYQYYHDIVPEAAVHNNVSHSLIANLATPWSLLCDNKAIPTRESGERYVVIERKSLCHCALTTNLHYIPPTITDCEGPSPGIRVAHPFNAVVQYHFKRIEDPDFDYLRNDENETVVPTLKITKTAAMSQVLSDGNDNIPVSVHKVFKMIDSKKETYMSKAEYLQSRSEVKNWFSGNNIVWGIILIMSIIGVIALIIVLCQMHQTGKVKSMVSTAMLGGQLAALPTVKAEDLASATEWATKVTLERMYVVVIGFAFLLFYYFARQLFRKFILYRHILPSQNTDESVHESQLFLELASSTESLRLYLTSVRAAAIQLIVPTPLSPRVTNLKRTLWYTTVTLDWQGQSFYIYDLTVPLSFPTIVPVPIYRWRKIRRIMNEVYSTRILILQDVYYALDSVRGSYENSTSAWNEPENDSVSLTAEAGSITEPTQAEQTEKKIPI